jgi:hypothetical protein
MTTDLANNPAPEANAPGQELADNPAQEIETEEVETEAQEGQAKPDDTDEIEYEGGKFRVPKVLKDAFLRQADYTRKTQEVADQRKAHEERERQFGSQVANYNATRKLAGRLDALDEALAQFKNTDWASLYSSNREQFDLLQIQERQLMRARDDAARELQIKVTEAQRAAEADTANRRAKLAENLARDIPGYSTDTASKMEKFGVATYGFSAQEIAATTDARLHRMLHDAMIGREAIAKAAKAAAAAKTAEAAEAARPSAQVGSRAPAQRWSPTSKAAEQTATDEWMRRRNEQVRKGARA